MSDPMASFKWNKCLQPGCRHDIMDHMDRVCIHCSCVRPKLHHVRRGMDVVQLPDMEAWA